MAKFVLNKLDKIFGPFFDQFFPPSVMWLDYTCRKCKKEFKMKSYRQFLFEVCEHK